MGYKPRTPVPSFHAAAAAPPPPNHMRSSSKHTQTYRMFISLHL